ncbi:MAG TPA: PKD domain-containing protein [Candidatus Saccharimonadales bacterium]|nr:PKD domain-containing protein [Candidatus Saccharimonadales bacterium]
MRFAKLVAAFLFIWLVLISASPALAAPEPQNPQGGSVGLQGEIPAAPPAQGATITVPGNGQIFHSIPITVGGICPTGLLVEIYKNNVFSGSVMCVNGSFSLQSDLFDGSNDLVARVYDSLNQPGPDSPTVTVTFSALSPSPGPRISLTSAYAKRGAVPGTALNWPITLSGGQGPYALSVDWGDKTTPDLMSRPTPGNIELSHIYKLAGVYNVTIKATDTNGETAFLQVVGIGNGPIAQSTNTGGSSKVTTITKIIWWPLLVMLAMVIAVFWIGKRQEIEEIRARIRKGQKPF